MKLSKSKFIILYLLVLSMFLTSCNLGNEQLSEKPVIYLYPEEEQEVNVVLDYKGDFIFTYPEYNEGWEIIASPDGRLINKEDEREYSYLFWEGRDNTNWDMSKGFVVKGKETLEFLQEKLQYLGLTPKEYNEFIVYWIPRMQDNKYNLITFAGEEYEELAELKIAPKPDSILRVMMVFKELDKPIDIEEQQLKSFERKGFTVVEWGGREVK